MPNPTMKARSKIRRICSRWMESPNSTQPSPLRPRKDKYQEFQWQIDDAGFQQMSRGGSRPQKDLPDRVIEKARCQYDRRAVLEDAPAVRHCGETEQEEGE